jgi:hypothetical protein
VPTSDWSATASNSHSWRSAIVPRWADTVAQPTDSGA